MRRIAMHDDFHSRAWADNHHRLSGAIRAAIHKLARDFSEAMARKNAYEFDAPWLRPTRAAKSPAHR
jgi:hypothetical protein